MRPTFDALVVEAVPTLQTAKRPDLPCREVVDAPRIERESSVPAPEEINQKATRA